MVLAKEKKNRGIFCETNGKKILGQIYFVHFDYFSLFIHFFFRFYLNMTDETEDSKVSLTSSEKTISSIFFTLKVPNFFTLPEYDSGSFDIRSPTFEFANATWCFRFEDREKKKKEAKDWVKKFDVDIIRLHPKNQQHALLFNITLFTNGKKYDSECSACFLPEEEKVSLLVTFAETNSFDDRRDILTLAIHLVSGESLVEEETITTDRGK